MRDATNSEDLKLKFAQAVRDGLKRGGPISDESVTLTIENGNLVAGLPWITVNAQIQTNEGLTDDATLSKWSGERNAIQEQVQSNLQNIPGIDAVTTITSA